MTDATATASDTAYDELLNALRLSRKDLGRLQNYNVNVIQLMTEHIKPIAQQKELVRQEYLKDMWDYHQMQTREAEANNTEPPIWYNTEPHNHKLTDHEALEELAYDIDEGIRAHAHLDTAKAYHLGIKDELPEWMTWKLLGEWSRFIKTEGRIARLVADYVPMYPEI